LAQILARHANLPQELAAQLQALAEAAQLHMNFYPQVMLVGDDTLAAHEVRVQASYRQAELTATQELDQLDATPAQTTPREAHLIIAGKDHFPLNQALVNIGRQADNHIILDNPTLSRQHCQLKLRFGHYILYDLQSKAGTFVNGFRVQEHRLQTGDVIGCGSVQIVYVEYNSDTQSGDTEKGIPILSD